MAKDKLAILRNRILMAMGLPSEVLFDDELRSSQYAVYLDSILAELSEEGVVDFSKVRGGRGK